MYHWQPWSSQELIYHVVTLANYENIDLVVIYHKKKNSFCLHQTRWCILPLDIYKHVSRLYLKQLVILIGIRLVVNRKYNTNTSVSSPKLQFRPLIFISCSVFTCLCKDISN